MKTKINYRHYRLPFWYTSDSTGRPPDDDLSTGWPLPSSRGGKTECSIEFYDDNDILLSQITGYAYCSMSDTYVKSVGREIAFNRAMRLYQYHE